MKRRSVKWNLQEKIVFAIYFAIYLIIGMVIGTIFCVSIRKVSAMTIDYEPFEKQMTAIQQNPDLLLKTDCNISISNNVITVKFNNDECSLTVQYDQNFEVLSTSKTNKYMFWSLALAFSTLVIIKTLWNLIKSIPKKHD